MVSMRIDRGRIAGAAGFALFCTLMFAIGQLLDRDIDLAGLAGAFLISVLIGYLAWPGLAEVWARRDRQQDRKRFLVIGLGLAAGFAISQAVSVLAGPDAGRWAVGWWFISVSVFGILFVKAWLARRS